jgi:hypothetical protein
VSYKDKSLSAEDLIASLERMLDTESYFHLMRAVVPFLPSKYRQYALDRAEHLESKYGDKNQNAPNFALKLPSAAGTLICGLQVSSKANCVVCKEKCKSPFEAKCKHVACHACWLHWFKSSDTCPECLAPTRVKQLTKIFFS